MAFKLSFDFCCLEDSNDFPGLGWDTEESEEVSLSGTPPTDPACCPEDRDLLFRFESAMELLGWYSLPPAAERSLQRKK